MPTEFLTDEQEQAYGRYVEPPSAQQLSRYFHLDDADRERVNERRGAGNKLGFAVQLTTVGFLGTFLGEPTDVPSDVVAYVATYREGQEDQLGALGLVLNAIVLWNTRYMDLAVAQLRARGMELQEADIGRLSSLGFRHVNVLGRYAFTLPEPGRLRRLRDPEAVDDE